MRRKVTLAILVIIATMIPFFMEPYWMHVAIIAYYYALLASSWSLLAGYAGQFSFGHMAFAAIGGYTSALLGHHAGIPPLLSIPVGIIMAGLIGFLIGVLCLRLKGAYLALFTIAFSETLRVILSTEYKLFGGAMGIAVEPLFEKEIFYYYMGLGILVLSLAIMYKLVNSRSGLFFRAIREDEQAASSMGVNIVRYKILAFTISSSLAGLAGAFYGHFVGLITPSIALIPMMALVIAMTVIGGIENLIAAALGAIILQFGLEWLREFGVWRLVLFGVLLMLTLRFAQNGLVYPLYHRLLEGKMR
jgi:branched-chain amino acid transport system permease protein